MTAETLGQLAFRDLPVPPSEDHLTSDHGSQQHQPAEDHRA
jgi:hypothetical protein